MFAVVVALEGGGHLVICLDELVDRVGRVALGLGDLQVDVVAAVLGVGFFRIVCVVPIPAALDTGPVSSTGQAFRRYDGCGRVVRFVAVGAWDGFPPRIKYGAGSTRERRFACRERPFDCAQGRLSGKDSVPARSSSRAMCPMSSMAACILLLGLKPRTTPCMMCSRKLTTVLPWSVLSRTMPATRGSSARDGAAGVRGWVPDCSGTTDGALGAPLGVALYAGKPGYGFGHELGGDCLDLHSGVSPVACLEALVVELAVGDVEVELDDGVPVVGLLADDVCEGAWPSLFCFVVIAQEFYYGYFLRHDQVPWATEGGCATLEREAWCICRTATSTPPLLGSPSLIPIFSGVTTAVTRSRPWFKLRRTVSPGRRDAPSLFMTMCLAVTRYCRPSCSIANAVPPSIKVFMWTVRSMMPPHDRVDSFGLLPPKENKLSDESPKSLRYANQPKPPSNLLIGWPQRNHLQQDSHRQGHRSRAPHIEKVSSWPVLPIASCNIQKTL